MGILGGDFSEVQGVAQKPVISRVLRCPAGSDRNDR